MDDGWPQIWASLTDEELEQTLFDYIWLASRTPNTHAMRIGQLIVEAGRRDRQEMVERVRVRIEQARSTGTQTPFTPKSDERTA